MDRGEAGNVRDPGALVVPESRSQIAILFGFLTLAFAAALGRGVAGAHSTSGRVAAAAVFGVLLLVCVRGWIMMVRRPARLEITEDAVRYVSRNGRVSTLSRQQGDELRFIRMRRGPRAWTLELAIAGTDAVITLGLFSRNAVRQACLDRGWRFDDHAGRGPG